MNSPTRPMIFLLTVTMSLLVMANIAISQTAIPNPVCFNDPIYLFCDLPGCDVPGATYSWTSDIDPSWISHLPNPVILPGSSVHSTGKFFLSVNYSPPPGGFSGGRVSVVVLPEIVLSFNVVQDCSVSSIYLAVSGGLPLYSYLWSHNNETTKDLIDVPEGTYTVTVTDANGCVKTESILVTTLNCDFGDAPEPRYPTTLQYNGARHALSSGLKIGWLADAENDGYQSTDADGDDIHNLDDEDGVVIIRFPWLLLHPGQNLINIHTENNTGQTAMLQGWIDFNGDGWDNQLDGDHVIHNKEILPGIHDWQILTPVPVLSQLGFSFARFRLSTMADLSYTGLAPDGEVEDYWVNIDTISLKPTPDSSSVHGETIGFGQITCFNASHDIVVAGNGTTFTVQNGGYAAMVSGGTIRYLPGTGVQSGGFMHGYITQNNEYCNPEAPKMILLNNGKEDLTVEGEKSFFTIYPNPTTGEFSLELNDNDETAEIRVDVYGMFGERVASAERKGQRKYDFSLTGKPVGVYFIRVVTGKYAGTGKIIKQ